ncbi:hypothetical protein FB45DRAFT_1130803 [Roridomyces roridus]|uniref:Uncharacterized protein n=1 Tax=Roridomyces roridus TaxID=1738132 RepID=A0AAD7B305_9AGAR|nr:hypothetical protein FB45DRAFT_1130803 [Roridomyces roridus]
MSVFSASLQIVLLGRQTTYYRPGRPAHAHAWVRCVSESEPFSGRGGWRTLETSGMPLALLLGREPVDRGMEDAGEAHLRLYPTRAPVPVSSEWDSCDNPTGTSTRVRLSPLHYCLCDSAPSIICLYAWNNESSICTLLLPALVVLVQSPSPLALDNSRLALHTCIAFHLSQSARSLPPSTTLDHLCCPTLEQLYDPASLAISRYLGEASGRPSSVLPLLSMPIRPSPVARDRSMRMRRWIHYARDTSHSARDVATRAGRWAVVEVGRPVGVTPRVRRIMRIGYGESWDCSGWHEFGEGFGWGGGRGEWGKGEGPGGEVANFRISSL